MKRIIKPIFSMLIIPFTIGFSRSFYDSLANVTFLGSKMHYFLWGIVVYMIIHILFLKPFYIYTWGHEIIHVLATWVCGGRVTSFKVSKSGGSVTTSKSNFFIELSPYFVPIYTLLLIFFIPVVRYYTNLDRILPYYIFLIGFSLGMHLIMTTVILKVKQPDILKSGYLFSYSLVYITNLIVVFGLIAFLTKDLTFKSFLLKSFEYSVQVYRFSWAKVTVL